MPSSKSSVDHRDVYYRLGKSAGYRARSAYKLLHLDEEFDLFTGVRTAVDLCAAPGSWSQVLEQKLKPGKKGAKVVSLDLQPMAPLSNITILQTDITLPSTVPLVLDALGGRKADLVVCDGAPDVTGVHDLDAYLHSQLLLAALTLSLTLLAPHATVIFKIFLSQLDPRGAMLRSQLEPFFKSPPACSSSDPEPTSYEEFEDTPAETYAESSALTMNAGKIGFDREGRRGGVWVRKPRSSRKGSGEAFIVCRNFDSTKVPLPETFPPEALAALAKQTTGTLTLDSLSQLGEDRGSSREWAMIKPYVGSGDLNPMADLPILRELPSHRCPRLDLNLQSDKTGLRQPQTEPSPFGNSAENISPPSPPAEESFTFLSPAKLHLPTPYASNAAKRAAASTAMAPLSRQASTESPSPSFTGSPTSLYHDRPWDRHGPSPLPSPNIMPPGEYPDGSMSMQKRQSSTANAITDGGFSPAFSTSSKTDFFFTSPVKALPLPPKALPKTGLLGRRHLNGSAKGHDRAASLPMPRLEEIKGHGRTPSDGPTAITLTTPTPVSPSIPKEAKAAHRSTSSPVPSASRVVSGQIPSSPVSTLPTMPDVFSASSCRTSHHLEREHREALEEIMLNPGDVFAPSPDEESRGDGSSWRLESKLGEGAFSSVWSASPIPPSSPQVAAIKLMDKRLCSSNARTKIAFIREVEVLRHISHPSIVSFLASFSTQTHHCLVLERLEGGELFELMSDEDNRRRMVLPGPLDADGNGDAVGEGFVRRVFGILVKAVGWLHEVGVVHRDIKLENILLPANPFLLPPTSTGSIPLHLLPSPLLKLTDFGLSRFISPTSPLLQTRCGSENFAAPEIIMGRSYDGRLTDAWACGVVLFALITGGLPFDEAGEVHDGKRGEREERKRRLMRIAREDYKWPVGVGSEGVKKVVARLLVRDPGKRGRVGEIWDEEWMSGFGGVEAPIKGEEGVGLVDGRRSVLDGYLVDGDGIGEVARAEEADL